MISRRKADGSQWSTLLSSLAHNKMNREARAKIPSELNGTSVWSLGGACPKLISPEMNWMDRLIPGEWNPSSSKNEMESWFSCRLLQSTRTGRDTYQDHCQSLFLRILSSLFPRRFRQERSSRGRHWGTILSFKNDVFNMPGYTYCCNMASGVIISPGLASPAHMEGKHSWNEHYQARISYKHRGVHWCKVSSRRGVRAGTWNTVETMKWLGINSCDDKQSRLNRRFFSSQIPLYIKQIWRQWTANLVVGEQKTSAALRRVQETFLD